MGLTLCAALILLVAILIQAAAPLAAAPRAAQDDPTPTLPIPFATLAPDSTMAALAADFPRVDGSTSAWPLLRLVMCQVYGVSCFWMNTPWGAEREIMFFSDGGAETSEGQTRISEFFPSGTHDAYVNLITGDTDLIIVAREPSQDEIDAADEAGIELDVQPVALDAFVFLLNVANPLDGLTLDEIRAIYTGEITQWTELGVEDLLSAEEPANPIHAFIRDANSGSQELMVGLVMGDRPMIDAPDMMVLTMMGLISEVDWDPLGIGYSVYYYTCVMAPGENLKLAAIEGVAPTSETIAAGSYPLTAEVYMVLRADMPDDSPAARLRDWLLSETGQGVVASSGYVPISAP